jgi:hypothetical protein
MKIVITTEDYIKCEKASCNMWANSKKGVYGKGLINNNNDPYKAERVGKLGEVALAKVLGGDVDFSYKEKGDFCDITVKGKKVDIKTALRNYGELLVYARHENGRDIELKSDLYIAAVLLEEDRIKKRAIVDLIGWCTRKEILANGMHPGKNGAKHLNYVAKYSSLKHLDVLIAYLGTLD